MGDLIAMKYENFLSVLYLLNRWPDFNQPDTDKSLGRLAPVLKIIFHQCVISYTCSQSYSGGSVLKQSHQS